MVKGITRRVVLIKSPDPRVFDEAIFIVKEDVTKKAGVTNEEILREAQSVAENYVRGKRGIPGRLASLPPYAYALMGACCTGLIWLLTAIL